MTEPLTPYLLGVLKLYAAHASDGLDPVHGTPLHSGKVAWLKAGFPQLAELGFIKLGADGWAITDDGKAAIKEVEKTA